MSDTTQPDLPTLQRQLKELESAIQEKKREEVKVLVDGFARKLTSLGLPIESAIQELKGYAPKRAGRASTAQPSSAEFVLYANPSDARLTWGGVGRKPTWLVEYLAAGGSLERLKV